MNKKIITDLELRGKKVLMRVDFNVPLKDGVISDNARIRAALPSIRQVLEKGGSLILMSHLGRPKGEKNPQMSLRPCADELSRLINKEVKMASECVGEEVEKMACELKAGEILMLENVRFHKEEDLKTDLQKRKGFAQKLASLGDIYINDAFGTTHREHASTADIAEFLPSAAGFLIEKELKFLGDAIESPTRPLVAILGGAKVSDKIPVIERLLEKADKILIGGGMAYTFYVAKGYEVGKSLLDPSLVDRCKAFLARGKEIIVLPDDCQTTRRFDFATMKVIDPLRAVSIENIPHDAEGLDIGPKTIEKFKKIISSARTILWNGPMGVFECQETAKGTFAIARILAEATSKGTITIIGGGDSAAAIKKAGLADKMTHISTGGGASLEFMEGKILPCLAVLDDK